MKGRAAMLGFLAALGFLLYFVFAIVIPMLQVMM